MRLSESRLTMDTAFVLIDAWLLHFRSPARNYRTPSFPLGAHIASKAIS
jgi:hypothetical protein